MQDTVRNLSSLKSIAETLNQSLDLTQALHHSLAIIVDILDLQAAWVFLAGDRRHQYKLAAHTGLPPALDQALPVWKGGCQCNSQARDGKLCGAVNMIRCSRIESSTGDCQGLTHHASIPLETPRAHIGILNVAASHQESFPQEDLDLLTAVGHQMGVAIERALMFENIRKQRRIEQASLLQLSNALISITDLKTVIDEVVRISMDIFGADYCAFSLHNGEQLGDRLPFGYTVAHRPDTSSTDNDGFCLHGETAHIIGALSRAGHFLMTEQNQTQVFPLEEKVEEELLARLKADEASRDCWREHGFRSLFIAPIRSMTDGETIGLLYVAHRAARQMASEVHLATLVCNQAALAIDQARLYVIEMEQRMITQELATAREIQAGFLPSSTPIIPGWEVATRYEAARHVGGDFYDFIPFPDGRWGFVVADVAGKGIPASLVMALSRTLVRGIALEKASPFETISTVNRLLLCQSRKDRFLSLFYAILDPESGRLDYVRAGHNPPFHYCSVTHEVGKLDGPGMVLGVLDPLILEERSLTLTPGDSVVFYTDGVTEAMTSDNCEFGEARLATLLHDHHNLPAEDLAACIQSEVARFTSNAPLSDDFTLITLKWSGHTPSGISSQANSAATDDYGSGSKNP